MLRLPLYSDMMTPMGGMLVAGLYFAFTAILWVGLNPRIRNRSSGWQQEAPGQSDKDAGASTSANLSVADDPVPPLVGNTEESANAAATTANDDQTTPARASAMQRANPEASSVSEPADFSSTSAPAATDETARRLGPALFLFWIAAIAHGTFTVLDLNYSFPDAGIAKAFSMTSLLMMVFLLILCARYRLHLLLLFFAPLAGMAVLTTAMGQNPPAPFATQTLVYWHLIIGLVGATICLLTLPLAFIAQRVSHQLRHGTSNDWFLPLPPLAIIEKLIVQLLSVATVMLSIAIVLIVPTITDIGAQHLAHKIFFSVFALLILVGLLGGRWLYGWRGKKLVWMVYSANACLILAYFGTKTVLELILQY